MRGSALLLCAGLLGCTFEEGSGFATIESAELRVVFEPGAARDLGNDTFLTSDGVAVAVTELSLGFGELHLNELTGGSTASVAFDPANPPPGYSLCHAGHCHSDDGRLVDYADIEAELAGGDASFEPVVTARIDTTLQALDDPTLKLSALAPSRELPRVRLQQASLSLNRLRFVGAMRMADDSAAAWVPLTLDLAPVGDFERGVELNVTRDGPARVDVRASFRIDGAAFDDAGLGSALTKGAVTLDDVDHPIASALLGRLSESAFQLELSH